MEGYLPDGYNYNLATNADSLAYDPEYSWTAEIGAKGRFGDIDGGLALFRTLTSDKQIIDLIPGGKPWIWMTQSPAWMVSLSMTVMA